MDTLLNEIEAALKARLYYLAVAMALTLPDICAALESEDGESSGPKYKAWYNANLAAKYPYMTDLDMWKLRCGVLHQGRCGHPQMQYDRVLFTFPNDTGASFHNNIVKGGLNLDAAMFCRDVIAAARKWSVAKKGDPAVAKNLPNLVQLRPYGLPPYMVGMPVIA